ncbi:probable serine/threonine-protein kinase clkA [Microplitis mediator]|uniref:probable serine/threonine-protein kinase clkA n=1 Tax=Microplitis mediator TaxID=375433 RepID=UPI0025528BFF|nr:probable serine/threonine-protein kinase clkA [Microplitis mediator]
MNKSPFSTPRGRHQGQSEYSPKPYYRKQRGYWNNKNNNSNSTSPSTTNNEQLNTSGSSDDYIPFNNSLPSPFSSSLPSPSLSSPSSTLSPTSPFYRTQKQTGQFYGQHQRYSLGRNDSPGFSPRGNFNKSFSPKFNPRYSRGRNSNHYQGKKESNGNNYVHESFFEDPWKDLVEQWEKTRSRNADNDEEDKSQDDESLSQSKLDDSSFCQSHLDDNSFNESDKTDSDSKEVDSQDEGVFPLSQEEIGEDNLETGEGNSEDKIKNDETDSESCK